MSNKNYVKIVNGIVVQRQPSVAAGFEAAPDDVVCGMIKNEDGSFSLPVRNLQEFIETSCKNVDTKAESARKKYITAGEGQAMVYQQKVSEAEKYAASTNPVDTDYPLLKAEAAALNSTVSETSSVVLATRAQWLVIAAQIESVRVGAKAAIKVAGSVQDVQAVLDSLVWP